MKYLLKLSYLGTSFAGFQVQRGSDKRTVQGELCRAARELFGTECKVTGCSRTDSGVHALEYAATLETSSETVIPPEKLPRAMGAKLCGDVSVTSAAAVPDGYSVRRHVKEKEYEYLILNSPAPSPFYVGRAWHVPFRLDDEKMNAAAEYFIGRHDFRSFMASGSQVKNTERTVSFCRVSRDGDMVKINVRADGFLYNMVRIIVGTLVEVSEGKKSADDMPRIIAALDRKSAGRTAPPDGLYLKNVILN
ncbi:MAG: tRNA pseudouridine(38-40) synthase TruA [Clostridia bacterium]|nr:tRNA pseudouridine(38-40) synthase TruA [Clostridia bacterium]